MLDRDIPSIAAVKLLSRVDKDAVVSAVTLHGRNEKDHTMKISKARASQLEHMKGQASP